MTAAPAARQRERCVSFERARIPREARAILEALRFGASVPDRLAALDEGELRKTLAFCDPAQLTLTLGHVCADALPAWVRQRIAKNRSDYARRFARLTAMLDEILDTLKRRGIDAVVLKGVAHAPHFTPDPVLRAQGDIDLWCASGDIQAARQALLDLGYRPYGSAEGRHLPPMVRERAWEWRGDYFDPALPIPVELHYRLWDEEFEAIPAPCEQAFWERRAGGRLALPDALGFAALHLLMHLLHGDLRLQRAWEIAYFQEHHADDDSFWDAWWTTHPPELQRLEAIVLRLTAGWFGAALSPRAAAAIQELPPDVRSWTEHFALSPVEGLFQPNKDEIWLQLCLVERFRDRCAVLRRRLFPVPSRGNSGSSPHPHRRRLHFLSSRTIHHARALVPALWSGLRWWWLRQQPGPGFLRFQAASALFCLGMSVYFLLFNLYLLGVGYGENLLGKISGMMSLGTLLGALPAAAISRRIGLRNTLLIAIGGAAIAAFTRVLNTSATWQLFFAFVNGLLMSLWAVTYAPAIAGLSGERTRRLAFSLACATGMSMGILGGLVGGRLPGAIETALHCGALEAKRTALLGAAAFAGIGALPALRLRFCEEPAVGAKFYPRSRFLVSFLLALACWSVAVGAFNPFYNAFFARLSMGIAEIGSIHASAQLAQVAAVLSAPAVFRSFGEGRGVAAMQFVTGVALVLLSLASNASIAVLAYIGFASFQYMSEPGLFQMLMGRVSTPERSGASALYFLVTSLSAALAAFVGGASVSRFGYSPVLSAAALLAMLAALLFRRIS